jgi:flagella synthesis protein FlgN
MNANDFLACLQAQQACVAALRELLAHEQEAMAGRRFTELQSIGQRKETLLEQLGGLEREREATQKAAGFSPGRAGADAVAIFFGQATHQAWCELLAAAALARSENLQAGSAVWAHLDFTQRALNFLQASAQLFYGPDGARRSTAVGAGSRLAAG